MLKNIIIVLLVGLLAFFLISSKSFQQDNSQNKNEEISQNEIPSDFSINTPKTEGSGNSLDLSDQNLEKLPTYVLDQTSLEVLNISGNNLTGALPAEIRHLKNLKVLDASGNKMTGVPAEIGQLEKLEVLDLSNNKLTGLPNEMANLKNLKKLDLSGNDYSEQDLNTIKQGLSSDVEIVL